MASSRSVVVLPGEGRAARGGGGSETLIKLDGSETDNAVAVFEQIAVPGSGPPLHIHKECSEALYVMEGEVEFQVGPESFNGPKGTLVFVPTGVPHRYRNTGSADARILFWFTPAARMAGYFDELANLANSRPTARELAEIARRHGVEIVGPLDRT